MLNMFFFIGAAASKKTKNEYQLLNPFPSIMYDIMDRNSKSRRSMAQIEYYARSLTKINRPAFVVPESAVASTNFCSRIKDLQECRFTSIPYAFLDRSGWSDIRRGITCAETELKAGESRRTIPLSTNTTDLRNQILQKIIFKGLRIQNTTNIEEDSESDDDQDDDLINDDNNSETDEMYEQGLDTDQFAFLTSI